MNGPDSISDPVARRLCCTESYPLARGSARLQLGSAQLGSMPLGLRLVTWQVGPTVMTCLMTGRWRVADWTLTCLLTGRWHACWLCILASWCRHPYPGLARGSGRLVFGSGQLIRVKKMRVTRGARLCAWAVSSPARAAVSDVRFRRGFQQWLHLFLLYTVVWSKHNFDNFHFWAKSNTPLNHVLWYQLLGIQPVMYWYLLNGG